MSEVILQPLQATFLTLAPSAEDYALHKAALEWDLLEPIVLENEQDFKSKIKWEDLVTPYRHQAQNLITFCRRLPVTLLADDVGLGKTISAGLVVSELLQRSRISKVLIICPRLLMPQWQSELKEKFGISSVCETGGKLIQLSEKMQGSGWTALITTYQSATRYMDCLEKSGFQMLILDEAHKLRNLFGTRNPPAMASRINRSLSARTFKYVLMLTATPIQNRLWDIYSLVYLLSVARGHRNPFGNEAWFAQRYIADSATNARHLKKHSQDEFRSIVYNYMSRVRRQDAELIFPERVVRSNKVQPTEGEQLLFRLVSESIQQLNALAQISIAKALVSSPQALASQLSNMAAKGTFPCEIARKIAAIAQDTRVTAKLMGLSALIAELRAERPADWRLVIFTELRETQNSIGVYLGELGIPFAFINGESPSRNQVAINSFKTNPPLANVIVSTAAGAEGVNLQSANVLLNYDLPWNPMIVEQRVGRVQRLGSTHQKVIIINSILSGTFEEKIVARLMEKLQLASHAIGDIESLLEAAGLEGDEKDMKFEEMLRKLVLASLAGKDVERETELKIASIAQAKELIKKEEHNINALLGAMDGKLPKGPRPPRLSPADRSMSAKEFILNSFKHSGTLWREVSPGVYVIENGLRKTRFVFDEKDTAGEILPPVVYAPGKPEFDRLVEKHSRESECYIEGFACKISEEDINVCAKWVNSFCAKHIASSVKSVSSAFLGKSVLRIRVSTGHDSYEKLVELPCQTEAREGQPDAGDTTRVSPQALGINLQALVAEASQDPDIAEFCRFYLERLGEELPNAGDDAQRIKKLKEDFTPRLQPDFVGLKGVVKRQIKFLVEFCLQDSPSYSSELVVEYGTGNILFSPQLESYGDGLLAPASCFQTCAVSNRRMLRHLLVKSEVSDKYAMPEYIVLCPFTNKHVLSTEVALSDLTGRYVLVSAMKVSAISAKRGESSYFSTCAFTGADVLTDELEVSQVSGKYFRRDEAAVSEVSFRRGHRSEFIKCKHTGKSMLPEEAERCDVTGELVAPGVLKICEVSGRRAVPELMGECSVTHKNVLAEYLVVGTISNTKMLKSVGVPSSRGNYCRPEEAIACAWDGGSYHPEDISSCSLTGLPIPNQLLFGQSPALKPLIELLNKADGIVSQDFDAPPMLSALSAVLGENRYAVIGVKRAENTSVAVIVVESKEWLGLKKRRHGFVYDVTKGQILGKIATGKWSKGVWTKL